MVTENDKPVWDKWAANSSQYSLVKEQYLYFSHKTGKEEVAYKPMAVHKEVLKRALGNSASNKRFHECIVPNKPMKLAFDVEKKPCPPNHKAIIPELLKKVKELFKATFPGVDLPEPVIRTATRPHIFSAHVTYGKWFASPVHVDAFLRPLADELDMGIYSAENIKTLRLPYCDKVTDPGRFMLPVGPDGKTVEEFSWETVVKASVSISIDTPPATGLLCMPDEELKKAKRLKSMDDHPASGRVLEFLDKYYGKSTRKSKGVSLLGKSDWEVTVVPFRGQKMYCRRHAENTGRGFHTHENSMRVSAYRSRVCLKCPDPACWPPKYFDETFLYVMYGGVSHLAIKKV